MRVSLNIPDRVWAGLVTVAEREGQTVALLLSGLIDGKVAPVVRRDLIVRLVKAGMCDADVAARTGDVVGYVAQIRRHAGLKPNRRYVRKAA